MKRYLLATAAAGLLMSAANGAFAQAIIVAEQSLTSSGSVLESDQSSALNATIKVEQAGADSYVNVLQDGGSSAKVYVRQTEGIHDASARITQIDGHADARIDQDSGGAYASGIAEIRQHFGGGEFDRNDAQIKQYGSQEGVFARIEQVGDTNAGRTMQALAETGSESRILQVGGSNYAASVQSLGLGHVEIRQGALGQNVYGNFTTAYSIGQGNTVGVYQSGDNAHANVGQSGLGLTALVRQLDDSAVSIQQDGADNLIDVTQTAHEASALLHQVGVGNVMTLTQAQDGVSAELTQNGTNNVMTVVQ